MILPLINQNVARLLLFLAISPGSKYSRKEIKEKTMMNNVPLDNSLKELLTLKVIHKNHKFYFLNLENLLTGLILSESKEKFSNLPLKVQFMLLEFISNISIFNGIKSVILFGSYAKLIYSKKSDIDIAVILFNKENKNKIEKKVLVMTQKLSMKYNKEIEAHFFIKEDMGHKEDPLIKDVLRGRILI